jgi:hypothetical protein
MVMSQKSIDRRKRAQGTLTRATSTLGLAGVGMVGASIASKKNPATLRRIQGMHPKLSHVTPEKMKDAAFHTGVVSGGLSGLGGYNFASYTSAEAKRNKKVKKNLEPDLEIEPTYGEEGIAKAWSPVATDYDPEAKRHKRNVIEQHAAFTGATAAGTLSAVKGSEAFKTHKLAGRVVQSTPAMKGKATKLKNVARGQLKTSGKYAAGAAGLAGAGEYVRRKRKGDWQSYSKSASTSAFGITHD